MAQDVRVFVSSHPCMKWAFSLTSLTSSSPSSSSFHSSSSSSSSCYPSTSPRLSSKIPVLLRQGDGVYWRILLQHRLWDQGLLPHRDVRRVQSGVHDRATVPLATVPRGRGSRGCRNRWHALQCDSLINSGEKWKPNTSSRSEMPVWTVSQKFCHP